MVSALDRFVVKCRRTQKHLDELNLLIKRFIDADPYQAKSHYDDKVGKRIIHCSIADEEDTLEIATVIEDVLHGMRSTLDHLAFYLVTRNLGEPTHKLYFPIVKTRELYLDKLDGEIKGAGDEAIHVFNQLEPYLSGKEEILFFLNTANNYTKHKLMVGLTVDITAHTATSERIADTVVSIPADYPSEYFLKGEMVTPNPDSVSKNASGTTLKLPMSRESANTDLCLEIVFGEPEMLRGKAVIRTLNKMNKAVLNVVKAFRDGGLF